MPNNLLATLSSTTSFRLKNLNGGIFLPAFSTANVRIRLTATMMKHMTESGKTVVDARIIRPAQITAKIFCSTIDEVDAVNKVLLDRGAFYSVYTKGLVMIGFFLDKTTSTQAATMLSATPTELVFKQVLLNWSTQVPIFKQSADSSVVDTGFSLLNSATQTVSGLYAKATTAISSIL